MHLWGDWIDTLVEQNSWRDKHGRPIYDHDIKGILGLAPFDRDESITTGAGLSGKRFRNRADVMELEVAPKQVAGEYEEDHVRPSVKPSDFFRDDGSFELDATPTGAARPLTELLQFRQPGRGDPKLLGPDGQPSPDQPIVTPAPAKPRGIQRGRKSKDS